jgi:hypothetical protein
MFGCAALFYGIGVYAQRIDKPMHFWSGTKVDPKQITDVERYNHENGVMWKLYSLWYVAAGLAQIWSMLVGVIILIGSCSIGLVLLILTYNKIYIKYRADK